MKTFLLILVLIFSTMYCKEKSTESQPSKQKTTVKNDTKLLEEKPIFKDFPKIPVRNFPVLDSTNFDNYQVEDGIKNDTFFKKIRFLLQNNDAENIVLNYSLNYSKGFRSYVISYYRGEHEIVTKLLNVDQNYQILDELEIAYDEIAESAFRKSSTLKAHEIVVEEWNYMSAPPIKNIENYQISKEGKFILVPN